jgi:hypothetical protein
MKLLACCASSTAGQQAADFVLLVDQHFEHADFCVRSTAYGIIQVEMTSSGSFWSSSNSSVTVPIFSMLSRIPDQF